MSSAEAVKNTSSPTAFQATKNHQRLSEFRRSVLSCKILFAHELVMEDLNTLVAQNTAFRSYADLAKAMTANGYTPSLRHDRKGPAALGAALEAKGHKVFWL